jgi:tol-pal system protein YbgF
MPSTGGTGVIEAYRSAYAAWRNDDTQSCIDQFRQFLQTNASSPFADDAAFWMADCYFKQGDYKTAILRFDDVVSRYPTGNKAADALYRQGEALLRLGPGYTKAAGKAFERVLREYPDSDRAIEARRQLEILGTG